MNDKSKKFILSFGETPGKVWVPGHKDPLFLVLFCLFLVLGLSYTSQFSSLGFYVLGHALSTEYNGKLDKCDPALSKFNRLVGGTGK
jgi:hypothetical protein